jgi:hypothetical protein
MLEALIGEEDADDLKTTNPRSLRLDLFERFGH